MKYPLLSAQPEEPYTCHLCQIAGSEKLAERRAGAAKGVATRQKGVCGAPGAENREGL
jgi:hypothetical protein